jgi:hypothetical protein
VLNAKNQLLQELNEARDVLWSHMAALDETVEIYPGWKKREFFAHMAGWDAMVFDVFRTHVSKQPPKDYRYTDVDDMNARFVAVRASTTVRDAKLECEINRFAMQTILEGIDDFSEVVQLPWGKNTLTEFVQGAIEHELSHATDIEHLIAH